MGNEISEEVEEFREWREFNYEDWELEPIAARLLSDLHIEEKRARDYYLAFREEKRQREAAIEQLNFLKKSAGIRAIWNGRVRINYCEFFKTLSHRQKRVLREML